MFVPDGGLARGIVVSWLGYVTCHHCVICLTLLEKLSKLQQITVCKLQCNSLGKPRHAALMKFRTNSWTV